MIFFLISFILSSIVILTCGCCKETRVLKYIYKVFEVDGYLRTQFLRFMLEGYIDLFLTAIVNTENFYLFDVPTNFGWNGNLTKSDQFAVGLGILFMILCLLFPFFILFIFL